MRNRPYPVLKCSSQVHATTSLLARGNPAAQVSPRALITGLRCSPTALLLIMFRLLLRPVAKAGARYHSTVAGAGAAASGAAAETVAVGEGTLTFA